MILGALLRRVAAVGRRTHADHRDPALGSIDAIDQQPVRVPVEDQVRARSTQQRAQRRRVCELTRFIPTLIAKGLEGRLPPLASPDIARDFVYSADVVDAFLTAATRNDVERGAIYNVGTGRQTTIGEAVSLARAAFAIEAEPVWASMKDRHWDTTTWVADPSKIKKELGWQARVPLEEGFARFTTWVREHPTHYTG